MLRAAELALLQRSTYFSAGRSKQEAHLVGRQEAYRCNQSAKTQAALRSL